jgi:hypothetical protein
LETRRSPRKQIYGPYPTRDLDFAKRAFNYRLSRARRTLECAFGILVATKKKHSFEKSIENAVDLADASIKSACVLRSFINKEQTEIYILMTE